MKTEEMIRVMKASLKGKTIQFRTKYAHSLAEWEDIKPGEHKWGWTEGEYRVKPEPIECWINLYNTGDRAYFASEDIAKDLAEDSEEKYSRIAVHMREVVEE